MQPSVGKIVRFTSLGTPCTVTYSHRHGHWCINGKYLARDGRPRQLPIQHETTCAITYGDTTVTAAVLCSAKDVYRTQKGLDDSRNAAVKQLSLTKEQRTAFYHDYFMTLEAERLANRSLRSPQVHVPELVNQLVTVTTRLAQSLQSRGA
jgi:hypothetical protein